ncbi:MAG: efflux RND transporter periplasmic adaptor subunit [Gammaproteobacteria bacterium]|nr:MAG: efflux RND transporter periplasmic adaptor subunit [Gammaproteobacteria bacterium]
MKNLKIIILLIVVLMAGMALGFWWSSKSVMTSPENTVSTDRKPLFYRNPMNPAITSPVPAKDSMGMDYIPVYAEGKKDDEPAGTVRIDPNVVQNIGVRTAIVEQTDISSVIRAVGRITMDEQRLTRLHPKIEGWIEKLFVDTTGEQVEKDDMLLGIYSPELVASQQEYLLALDNLDALRNSPYEDIRKGALTLVSSSLERLQLMDVPEHQILELKKTRRIKKDLHIHSPFNGIVMKVGVREGQYVTPKDELYMIADLSRVWVEVDVFENELQWIREGDEAVMQVAGFPGRKFVGKVSYIYPYMQKNTRTAKVRIEFDNRDLALKLDMFANVAIQARKRHDAIVIPAEAIVRSGEREQVFVVHGKGKFEPREVQTGLISEGRVQVLKGVKPGEMVVTSAQFLIDSESKLREATAKMMQPGSPSQTETGAALSTLEDPAMSELDMSDMDMSDMNMDSVDQSGVKPHD